ncbi:hypothetical protein HUT16_04015 [Kitasatospora sp. NA04385]|uniref:hypothetical protein n=1 Tax=Kitasatospora sp. NA04385 TaxID=2742135 RepID=UPI001591250C|nr:hypothetical protein [Kitasatospora sp. NA04385]QKW18340.1 hypothetical protein HUT16_04015 [Kitasatospora sp. NA04385]
MSSVALDVFTGSVNTGKVSEPEERSAETMRRDEEGDAAPSSCSRSGRHRRVEQRPSR